MDLLQHNLMQIEEMEKHKWIESEKAGRDLGDAARIDWIKNYAADWRKAHPVENDKLPTNDTMKVDDVVSSDIP